MFNNFTICTGITSEQLTAHHSKWLVRTHHFSIKQAHRQWRRQCVNIFSSALFSAIHTRQCVSLRMEIQSLTMSAYHVSMLSYNSEYSYCISPLCVIATSLQPVIRHVTITHLLYSLFLVIFDYLSESYHSSFIILYIRSLQIQARESRSYRLKHRVAIKYINHFLFDYLLSSFRQLYDSKKFLSFSIKKKSKNDLISSLVVKFSKSIWRFLHHTY